MIIFKINNSIYYKFELILKITLKFIINAINKNFIIFQKFLKKFLKFDLYYWDFNFKIIFLLILILYYYFVKN